MLSFYLVSIRGERMNPERKIYLDPLEVFCVLDPFETQLEGKRSAVIVSNQGLTYNVEGTPEILADKIEKGKEERRKALRQTIRVS